MADGEGFPDRFVAAQARNSVYSRGYFRRRQVELAEGKLFLFVLCLQTHCAYDDDEDDDGGGGGRAEADHHHFCNIQACRFKKKTLTTTA